MFKQTLKHWRTKMNITIYSTHTCAFCKMLREYLDQKDIKYEIKYADEDPSLAQELYQKSGQLGVPFTIIEKEDGKQEGILGFDKPRFDALFA